MRESELVYKTLQHIQRMVDYDVVTVPYFESWDEEFSGLKPIVEDRLRAMIDKNGGKFHCFSDTIAYLAKYAIAKHWMEPSYEDRGEVGGS